MEEKTSRMHASVKGLVQGVGFRFFVFQYGVNLNLRGWVRNRCNGEVELIAEGPREILQIFLDKIKQGPQMAHVDQVEVDWQTATGEFPKFTILETE